PRGRDGVELAVEHREARGVVPARRIRGEEPAGRAVPLGAAAGREHEVEQEGRHERGGAATHGSSCRYPSGCAGTVVVRGRGGVGTEAGSSGAGGSSG